MFRNVLKTRVATKVSAKEFQRSFSSGTFRRFENKNHQRLVLGLGLTASLLAFSFARPQRLFNDDGKKTELTHEIPEKVGDEVSKVDAKAPTAKGDNDQESSEIPPENNEEEEGEKHQSAYNPETGEINWDCPCLGGMAHGPCGEEFKTAFSCFIYSETEPRGIECIEKFQTMRDCFRAHPEHYAEELRGDEEEEVVEVDVAEEPEVAKKEA